uniref:Uncharacterized protein n=1 Tax=Timema cristinae TaxID=61476 RepID=A0A7R9CD60_TIMCR|nr:unnamed protein product [Timema cristinae]
MAHDAQTTIRLEGEDKGRGTLDLLLSTTYCRSQMYLSSQLAKLHPELTMPMFSEITHRFQMARPELRQLLLQYLLPWLHNMELVDPNVPPVNPFCYIQYYTAEMSRPGSRREGWGSAEATEMVLNNLFYITAKELRPMKIMTQSLTMKCLVQILMHTVSLITDGLTGRVESLPITLVRDWTADDE